MRLTFAEGNRKTVSKLLELRGQAQRDKEPQVVLRIQGLVMSLEGQTTGEIANQLKVHLTCKRAYPLESVTGAGAKCVGGPCDDVAHAAGRLLLNVLSAIGHFGCTDNFAREGLYGLFIFNRRGRPRSSTRRYFAGFYG